MAWKKGVPIATKQVGSINRINDFLDYILGQKQLKEKIHQFLQEWISFCKSLASQVQGQSQSYLLYSLHVMQVTVSSRNMILHYFSSITVALISLLIYLIYRACTVPKGKEKSVHWLFWLSDLFTKFQK